MCVCKECLLACFIQPQRHFREMEHGVGDALCDYDCKRCATTVSTVDVCFKLSRDDFTRNGEACLFFNLDKHGVYIQTHLCKSTAESWKNAA